MAITRDSVIRKFRRGGVKAEANRHWGEIIDLPKDDLGNTCFGARVYHDGNVIIETQHIKVKPRNVSKAAKLLKELNKLVVLVAVCFTLTGCNATQRFFEGNTYKFLRASGHDPNHLYSCGPRAICEALEIVHATYLTDASYRIVSRRSTLGWVLVDVIGLVSTDAGQITWPEEMKPALESYKLKVTEQHSCLRETILMAKECKSLKGVALIRYGPWTYHWESIQSRSIETCMTRGTIDRIYMFEQLEDRK